MADGERSKPLLSDWRRTLRQWASDRAERTLDLSRSNEAPKPPSNLAILTAPRAAVILLVYLLVGSLCFLLLHPGFEGRRTVGVVDALYFCVVTMTTVGYGDLVPNTTATKLFTCAFVFLGFGLISLILGNAANYFVEKQQKLLEKAFDPEDAISESKVKFVKHKVMVSAAVVVIILGTGVVVIMLTEEVGFVDAFYGVCVTATALGYGDQAFETLAGRICAVFWVLASTACVAQFLLYLAELITQERQQHLARWVLSRKITCSDVEAADIDGDGRLTPSEFVIYKLRELGKIEDDDIKGILDEFYLNDADQDGDITVADVASQ